MANNVFRTLSVKQLQRVIAIREKIDALEAELNQLVPASEVPVAAQPAKRPVSAATRRKRSAAQKARWARSPGEIKPMKPVTPKKRLISAQGRANISAAAKARWAKLRAVKAS